jgi:hypothetical protein
MDDGAESAGSSNRTPRTEITLGEGDRLKELEAVIERGRRVFVKVGMALVEIRDRRLYRQNYPNFDAYCRDRWGWSRIHAHRHIEAAELAALLPIGNTPANEAQARELVPLAKKDPDEASRLWTDLIQTYGNDLTAARVKQAVRLFMADAKLVIAQGRPRIIEQMDQGIKTPKQAISYLGIDALNYKPKLPGLVERFIIPPFDVINPSQPYYQDREHKWVPIIFDPVLTEVMYEWFCPRGGSVFDPFVKDSVRGLIAARTGRAYLGIVARTENLEANRAVAIASETHKDYPLPENYIAPQWFVWSEFDQQERDQFDFILTTIGPPVSEESTDSFLQNLNALITQSCAMLRQDRFACVALPSTVFLNQARNQKIPIESVVCDSFEEAGLGLYNRLVVTSGLGGHPFGGLLSAGKVLNFVKGDPRQAAATINAIER